MKHPPWLRFQAYLVGLPKTGSTSIASLFAAYRTAHEWQMRRLLDIGLARLEGEVDDGQFWRLTTPRLTRPVLEMDAATCHHLYPDLLVDRFPKAVFVHTVRDVDSWLSSLLDMAMRYRFARTQLDIHYQPEEIRYIDLITAGGYDHTQDPGRPDTAAVVPMMRYWAEHMRLMSQTLPARRSLLIRTPDIAQRLPDLAALCKIAPETLREDRAHSNRAEHRFDRLAGFATAEVRRAYDQLCADIMARVFPEEHARISAWSGSDQSWDAHVAATRERMRWAVDTFGESVAW